MEIFSILKIETLFPSLFIYFFPHFCPSPNPNFGVSWGKIRLDPPPYSMIYTLYTILQGSPTYGPRAKCGPLKKGHQKNLNGLTKKYMIQPSIKKAYNFFIFWPTYHKRLATPAIEYTICNMHYTVCTTQYTFRPLLSAVFEAKIYYA